MLCIINCHQITATWRTGGDHQYALVLRG